MVQILGKSNIFNSKHIIHIIHKIVTKKALRVQRRIAFRLEISVDPGTQYEVGLSTVTVIS